MNLSRWPFRFSHSYVSVVAVLAFCSLSAIRSSQPLHLDNMDFPAVALATSESGRPVYYRGEENPRHSGLYHPPLYIYLLAGWFRVVGFGEAQVRVFGMLCALAQGVLVLQIMQTIFGPSARRRCAPWFWLLFLLNPYTLQTAAIADIDSTIYGPAICLVLLLALRLSWTSGQWRSEDPSMAELALVAGALAVGLWCKLTTILLVIPFLCLLLVERFGWFRAIKISSLISLAGIGGFFFSYVAYGALLDLDVGYTFSFTLTSLLTRGASEGGGWIARVGDYERNFAAMAPFMARWTGLLPWVAVAAAISMAGVSWLRLGLRRAQHYGLVLGLALVSSIYYCAKVHTFGAAPFKYVFVYWGLVMTAPVVLAQGWKNWFPPEALHCKALDRPRIGVLTSAALAIMFLVAAILGAASGDDRILYAYSIGWEECGAAVLLAFSLLGSAWLRAGRRETIRCLTLASVAFAGGQQLGWALAQAPVDYSTTYDYGQRGLDETATFIRLNTAPDEIISSMKDLGFRAGRRYYENFGLIYGGPTGAQHLIDLMEKRQARFAVFTEGRGQDQLIMNKKLLDWVEDHCILVRSLGNYRIYELAHESPQGPARAVDSTDNE